MPRPLFLSPRRERALQAAPQPAVTVAVALDAGIVMTVIRCGGKPRHSWRGWWECLKGRCPHAFPMPAVGFRFRAYAGQRTLGP